MRSCRPLLVITLGAVLVVLSGSAGVGAPSSSAVTARLRLDGLQYAARLTVDDSGVTHIAAGSLHDVFFLNGWVHARDRLFQMDVNRRAPSGTLAELVGKAALDSDVQARTVGLRRAAERTWAVAPPELRSTAQAYADGVNGYVATHALPGEYAALQLTSFSLWTPIDSLTVGKAIAFQLSFDLDIAPTVQLQAYVNRYGPVAGVALFSQDVMRSQPFSDASTVPDATKSNDTVNAKMRLAPADVPALDQAARLGRAYLAKVAGNPLFGQAVHRDGSQGSNEWAVAGSHTEDGRPLVANDPHLSLGSPSTFYPIGLKAEGMDVEGEGFAGAPGVIIGHNRWISWGATTNPMDVTDTFQEAVVADPGSPSGLATVYRGTREPIIPIPETFRYNDGGTLHSATAADGVPAATLIVPRRNQGPIVQLDLQHGAALSVQYTGFSATFELQTFLMWDQARDLNEFRNGLSYFDVGSQNWAYADVHGNVAYFTSAEMPVREDLQAGTVHGAPPWFIRNGQGGNEWLPVQHPQLHQAIPYEIYPAAEMPHAVNPRAGWFVNANNDPAGTTLDNDPLNQLRPGGGIYYLNLGYDGFRGGRITEMLRQRLADGHKVFIADMQAMQADVTLLDAEYFVPHIVQAFDNARTSAVPELAALANNPAVAEAVTRLSGWDFTTPTGLQEGYDAHYTGAPSPTEIGDSVAATIYALWRSQAVASIIDAPLGALPKPDGAESITALKHLLDTFGSTHGVGASGVDFFAVPGVDDPAAARDYLLLRSLRTGLDLLASPTFAAAFHSSTDQDTYRWGLLHRIVLAHPLDGPFSVPPAFGQFPAPLTGLAGIPVDGGFGTVDAASHNVRAATVNGFMFGGGPARRYIGQPAPGHTVALSALPGGTSADPASPFYLNLLRPYLHNEYYPALLAGDLRPADIAGTTLLVPGS
jgi:penicillin amidase